MSAIFGETLVFSQGNGYGDVRLVVFGDEFYARYETEDGYTVVYDTDREQYCYAILLEGRFASSGAPTTKHPPTGIRRHLKESESVRNEKFEMRYSRMRPPEPVEAPNRMRTFGANEGLLPGRRVSEGNVKGLTVLVDFADLSTDITAEEVDALLNGENYRQNDNFCSVREYFRLMSSGKLNYTNRVVGPIKLKHNRSYYVDNLLVREALDIVVNDLGIDLSEFDSRGEGIVDALNFMYAGRTTYEGELWPHNWAIDMDYGGIRTHFYMLTSLGRRPVDLSIGTFCHENGHQLCRLPDLYDYGTRDGDSEKSNGIGVYCLMGSGNHLNYGRTPSPVCAYLRYLVDWQDQEVLLDGAGTHDAIHGDYGTIMKYETDTPNEYFLIENRTRLGLDAHIPDSGLAVYHCDILGSNEWQGGTRERHYQCGLLQADGHLDLENGRNYGDAGDLFDRVHGVALSHDTTPSSRAWDGSDSGMTISDISAPGGAIQFKAGEVENGLIVTGYNRADLLIPDYDPDYEPEGISSKIKLIQTGKVKAIKVGVDIIHTYVGDLRVELEAPSGKKAILREPTGIQQEDLQETYSSDSTHALEELAGESVAGDWKLNIQDELRHDTGRLNWWNIEIEYESVDQIAEGESSPDCQIPYKGTGLYDTIHIPHGGLAKDVRASVEIAHTFIADLIVELIAPSGNSVTLHNRTGRWKNDLRRSYDKSSVPQLEGLEGEQIQGDWELRIRDLDWLDVGTLEKWSIRVAY